MTTRGSRRLVPGGGRRAPRRVGWSRGGLRHRRAACRSRPHFPRWVARAAAIGRAAICLPPGCGAETPSARRKSRTVSPLCLLGFTGQALASTNLDQHWPGIGQAWLRSRPKRGPSVASLGPSSNHMTCHQRRGSDRSLSWNAYFACAPGGGSRGSPGCRLLWPSVASPELDRPALGSQEGDQGSELGPLSWLRFRSRGRFVRC